MLFAGLAVAQSAGAQSADRAGRWEVAIGANFQNSANVDFKGGTSADIKSGTGFKAEMSYHLTDNLQLSGSYVYDQVDYDAKLAGNTPGVVFPISGTLDYSTLMFNGTYNILSGPFTPFVTGGIGWSWVDTNIATSPPETGCWYDPWWGYVCTTWQDTKTIDGFAYQAGVGARYDFGNQFTLSASYRMTWINLDNAKSTPDFDGFDVMFGWKF
jgi:opacity protein-like surface antigen